MYVDVDCTLPEDGTGVKSVGLDALKYGIQGEFKIDDVCVWEVRWTDLRLTYSAWRRVGELAKTGVQFFDIGADGYEVSLDGADVGSNGGREERDAKSGDEETHVR